MFTCAISKSDFLVFLLGLSLIVCSATETGTTTPNVELNYNVSFIEPTDFSLNEGENVSVCVIITPEPAENVTVKLEELGNDLMVDSHSLILPSTTSTSCWEVIAVDDDIFEDTIESFTLNIMLIEDKQGTIKLVEPTSRIVNVMDNEIAIVSMNETSITRYEDNITVCIKLDGPSGGTAHSNFSVCFSSIDTRLHIDLLNLLVPSLSIGQVICGMLKSANNSIPVNEMSPRSVGIVMLSTNDDRVKIGANQTELFLIDEVTVALREIAGPVAEDSDTITVCVKVTSTPVLLRQSVTVSIRATGNVSGNNIHNVTIEANTTKKCTMLPLNDDIYQTSRSVNFSLSTNQERVNIGAPSSINVDVIDNDDPVVALQTSSDTLSAGSSIEICAVLEGPSGGLGMGETFDVTFFVLPEPTASANFTVTSPPSVQFNSSDEIGAEKCKMLSILKSDPGKAFIVSLNSTNPRVHTRVNMTTVTIGNNVPSTVPSFTTPLTTESTSTVPGNNNVTTATKESDSSSTLATESTSTVSRNNNKTTTTEESDTNTTPNEAMMLPIVVIAGAGGGAVVVIALLAILICIVCMVKRKSSGSHKPKKQKTYVQPLKPPRNLDFNMMEKDEEDWSREDLCNPEEKEKDMETSFNSSEDISVLDFSGHVKKMHRDDNAGFEREYRSVKDGGHSWAAGQIPENKFKKNRFTNIFPYDYCRVKLTSTGMPGSDYINASWINGYKKDRAYIAAQGPMVETINDFWRMIWENKLPTIVMVTKLVESAREKCSRYWPEGVGEELEAGLDLVILLKEIKLFTDYEIRIMSIKNVNDSDSTPFLVTHFYYLGWPDHGVPEYATSLLGYLRRIRKSHPPSGPPLLVHCSAGVGRTGTFMVLDAMLQRIQRERVVNVLQCVHELRERRCQMVQTMSQYMFIHDALNELITCGDTEIAAQNLCIVTNQLSRVPPGKSLSGYKEQFQLLDQVSRVPTQQDKDRIVPELKDKNRYPDKFPYTLYQPQLMGGSKQDQYINASFIDGYKRKRCFVATQAPLDNTVGDFWRMACKLESKTIVLLCDLVENGKSMCAQYWPDKVGESLTHSKVSVKLISESTDKDIIVRKLEVSSTVKATVSESYVLAMFHFKTWNENGTQPEPESVIHLNELVVSNQRTSGNKSIIVMCNDGCGRSGAFMSVYSSIDRFKVEAVVDVFQCVKAARINRMSLVTNVEQYILVHEVVKNYMNSFDQYANFTAQLL